MNAEPSSRHLLGLVLLTCLVLQSSSLCGFGCLSCDLRTQQCVYCDNLTGYYLSKGQCSYTDLSPNCLIVGPKGQCVFCGLDYTLAGGNCVTKSSLLTTDGQCTVFDATRACEVKRIGTIYRDLIYMTGFRQIAFCLKYSLDQKCIQCVTGYWVYYDGTSCSQISTDSNPNVDSCGVYAFAVCDSCKVGYKFDYNSMIHVLNSRLTDIDSSNLNFGKAIFSSSLTCNIIPHDPCIKTPGPSCQEEGFDGNCLLCVDGMALDVSLNCVPKPQPSIPYCRLYKHDLTCLQCIDRFYLASATDCRPVTPIKDCKTYDTMAITSKCIACKDQFFIQVIEGQTSCSPRYRSLADINCISLDPYADICLKCQDGFFLHVDLVSCLLNIYKCLSYRVTPAPNNLFDVACQVCELGFSLSNGACLPIVFPNCETESNDRCVKCLHGYYFFQNKCVANPNKELLSICQRSNSNDSDQCDTCNFLGVPVTLTNGCKLVYFPTPFCSAYNSSGVCVRCQAGFLLSSGSCVPPPDNVICIDPVGDAVVKCTVCRNGFVVDPVLGICVEVPPFITTNCDVLDNSSLIPSCQSCSQGYSPVVFDGPLTYCIHKSSNNLPIGLPSIVNCKTYSWNPSRCHTCNTNYVVKQSDGSCIPSYQCSTGVFIQYFELQNGRPISSAVMMCATIDTVPHCKYYALNILWSTNRTFTAMTDLSYVCSACQTNFMAGEVQTAGSKYTYSMFVTNAAHIYSSSTTSGSFTDRFPGLSACLSVESLWAGTYISLSTFTNCQAVVTGYSVDYSQDFYGCVQCQFGYTGPLIQTGSTTYINKCSIMTDCNTSVRYNGLGYIEDQIRYLNSVNGSFPNIPLSSLVTCHVCNDPKKIPFLPVINQIGDSTVTGTWYLNMLFRYDVSLSIPVNISSTKTSDNLIQCLDPQVIAATNKVDAASNEFPSNCGLGLHYINRLVNLFISTKVSHLCIACAPGFAATMIHAYKDTLTGDTVTEYTFAVRSCSVIPNCQSSTLFNGCSTCASGYSLQWDEVRNKPRIDSCVPTVSNCKHPTTDGLCGLCNRAFILHPNGFCYAADFAGCNLIYTAMSPGVTRPDGTKPLNLDYMNFYFATNVTIGCSTCDSMFQETSRVFNSVTSCMKNSFNKLDLQGNVIPGTETIPNCQTINVVNKVINCVTCNDGFVVMTGGLSCTLMNPYLVNCAISSITGVCLTCNPGYIITNEVCLLNKVQNCFSVDASCQCTECLPDFILVDSVCAYVKELNCGQLDLTNVNKGQLTCLSCSSFYYSNSVPSTISTCLKVGNPVSNCSDGFRDYNGAILCRKCQEGFFLINEGHSCVQLPNVLNCSRYSDSVGICLMCQDRFYLAKDGLTCLPNPSGVLGCLEYLTVVSCRLCVSHMYLKDGKCVDLPPEVSVFNCLAYSLELFGIECKKCNEGFYLENKECVYSNAKDCLMNFNSNTCSKCQPFHVLSTAGYITSCVKVSIPGCVRYSYNAQNKVVCVKCQFGMTLLSESSCVLFPSIISNCVDYDINTSLCIQCLPEYVLADNGQYCMQGSYFKPYFNDSCSGKSIKAEPVCVQCRQGYYFDSLNNCAQCMTDSTCMYCDPRYPTMCKVCVRGYYMNSVGACVINNDSQIQPKDDSAASSSSVGSALLFAVVMLAPLLLN